jgi:hypothetical protein
MCAWMYLSLEYCRQRGVEELHLIDPQGARPCCNWTGFKFIVYPCSERSPFMMQPRHIITVTNNKFSLYSCVQVDMVAFVLKSGSGALNMFVATMVLSGGLFSRKSGWNAPTHVK